MTVSVGTSIRSFDKLFIGGHWIDPSTANRIEIVSPITQEIIASVPAAGNADIDTAVAAARTAFDDGVWPSLSAVERASLMNRVADEIEKRIPEMVKSFTAEVGAPLAVSQSFHEMAPALWRRNAELIKTIPSEDARSWDGGGGVVVREPVGVVGAIVPWNGPVANVSLKMAPALAAGCSVVVKPAWEGPASTFLLAEALEAAGLPDGLVSIVPGGREVGEYLVGHRGVDKISFTGSTAAGRRVMEVCAQRIARVTLELGGKSAAIIAEDADLDGALPFLVGASVGHSGQVCAALTRVLAPHSRYDEIVDALGAALGALRVGDPFDPDTAIGPLVAERQRTRVEDYIRLGREAGARVVVGGGRPAHLDRGWYVEPTLFADVDNSMQIAREEIFGPVLVVLPYEGIDEAVAIANDSEYGLSGAVFTADPEYGEQIARRIRTGQIYVNSAGICTAEPFGGFKQSGLGREGGAEGIGAFLETKLISRAGA
ncbi:aldehyde dehydrogenase [Rhodococcus sp. 14-2483-1-2]|uniref:aldehyde dehydrogenase n=1 Tax=Rhodococcus sp. 14-2483-1-2 TaxID=2023147 RepID=UPI000B9A3597|nr:aldehyde dehydrogenase [Rhodococcus sp. 14-2483-1-2]OZF39566.1 aldehyde dehydrogenase [Rhodococcus sp. 14-2483-1-2]